MTEFFDLNRVILTEKRKSQLLQKRALSKDNFLSEPIEFFNNQHEDPSFSKPYTREWDEILGAYIPEKLDSFSYQDDKY